MSRRSPYKDISAIRITMPTVLQAVSTPLFRLGLLLRPVSVLHLTSRIIPYNLP